MINSLISNVSNEADVITNNSILLLNKMCKLFGMTYGELNVLIFFIMIPLVFIFYYLISYLLCYTHNKTLIKIIKIINIIVLLMSLLLTFLIYKFIFTI